MNSILPISTVVLYIAFALANIADALTTIAGLRRGAVERNPLLGKKPTAAKIWAVKAAVIAIGAVAALVAVEHRVRVPAEEPHSCAHRMHRTC